MNNVCTHAYINFVLFHNITTIIHFAIETNIEKKIVFFIENESHFRFIQPLFEYFLVNNFSLLIISQNSPFNESTYQNKNLEIIKLKSDFEKIKILKNLSADLFFTTTPSIGNSIFPKSKAFPKENRPKYIYLFHSMVSPNEMYTKDSFYNFDYIFSPSETISDQIKFLISKNTKVTTTGYLLFNNLKPLNYQKKYKDKILVAPTWGQEGLDEIIENFHLINNFINSQGCETVFRPHPMTNIENIRKDLLKIKLDDKLSLDNLHEYKYLITDYSGIALEFAYLTGRSSIFLNVKKKIKRRLSNEEKRINLIENDMRNIIGFSLNFSEINDIVEINKPNQTNFVDFIKKINFSEKSLNFSIDYLKSENLI